MNYGDLASILLKDNRSLVYLGPKDVFFQPVFQCCSREYAVSNKLPIEGLYSEMGIYLPNVAINKIYQEGEDIKQTEYVRELLEESKVNHFSKLIYAAFTIYHEEGHLVDFIDSGMSPIEFLERDIIEKIQVENQSQRVITNHYSEAEMDLFFEIYNMTRPEKMANDYAVNKVAQEVDALLSL